MRIYNYTIFILLSFHTVAMAQQQEYLFSYLGVRDGLQEENVLSVQQDAKGFIWIASQNALQRYDGQRFINFFHTSKNNPAIPGGSILGMQADKKKDRIWILSGITTLGYLDANDFTYKQVPVRLPPGDFNKATPAIHLDKDGNLLLIFAGSTFFTYSETNNEVAQKYNPFQPPPGWKTLYLWQDDARNYWLGANNGLLKYSASKKMMSYRGHNEENDPVIQKFENLTTVGFAYADKTNRFWITAWPQNGGVIQSYVPATGQTTEWQHSINNAIRGKYFMLHGVTEMEDSTIWMAGNNLFAKVNKISNKIEAVPTDSPGEYSMRYDDIHQLFEDREKNVWVCTNKGLYRFNPAAQLIKAVKNRLPGSDSVHTPDVTDLLQTHDGEILVSTWGDGIFAYDKNFNPIHSKYLNRVSPSGESMIWCLTQRKNGDIWRGSQEGYVFIYEALTGKTRKIRPPVFENSTVRQAVEDQNGDMWLGTQRGYLVKWTQVNDSFTLRQKLNGVISRLLVDQQNTVWVCTDRNGVFQVNSVSGRILKNYTSAGPAGKTLLHYGTSDIIQYNDSLMVIASNGLNLLNTRTGIFKYFSTENGLPSVNISNMVKDAAGYIWITSSVGIHSYHPFKRN